MTSINLTIDIPELEPRKEFALAYCLKVNGKNIKREGTVYRYPREEDEETDPNKMLEHLLEVTSTVIQKVRDELPLDVEGDIDLEFHWTYFSPKHRRLHKEDMIKIYERR